MTGINEKVLHEADDLKAEYVYLLMKKEYRISRNVRAQWFLEHLNSTVGFPHRENLMEHQEELSLISVVPSEPPAEWTHDNGHLYKYLITPTTIVIFLAEKYRMVYCLDISPSLSAVDIQLGEVMIDGMFLSLKRSLEGLARKFVVPGSKLVFEPEIYATIIAHTPFFTSPAQQVLVQGWQVTADNLPLLMSIVEQQLQELEGRVAEVSGIAQEQLDALRAESEKLVGGLFEEALQPTATENPMVSPDTGFINMLRFGMLALKLLPDSSSANIVVVTDGIINIPDVNVFDSVLSQLRSSTVACSFIQVAGPFHPYCCKGFVPYTELMHFIAAATLGAYISSAPLLENNDTLKMNVYHNAFLTWSFQKRLKEFGHMDEYHKPVEWLVSNQFYGSKERLLIRKKQLEDNLNTSLSNVLSCRLREGYTIKSVKPLESSRIEICLILPWKNDIYIEYTVTAQWPQVNSPVHYMITIEAPYEFLHDITCLLKKPFKSHYRQAVVARFWHTLKTLAHTDQLLVHLHSFTSNVASHSLPESIKSGMPLFYLPANSNTPVLSSSDLYPQFSMFWKPVCLLDAAVWQKWLHPHRLGLLLQHDHPLPRHLHQANPSGRFQQVQCRQAASVLYATLKAWSSFVLIENHSYVKIIQGENEKSPSSFLLMRVTSKPPCVVINMAFLGGSPGSLRHQIVETLKKKIVNLTLPQRPLAKDSIIRKISTVKNPHPYMLPEDQKVSRTASAAAVTWSDLSCCILLTKPVEKILIRYERMPSDFATVVFPDGTQPLTGIKPVTAAVGGSMLTTLSRYLHHRRWIWVAQQDSNPSVTAAALTRTLSTITKMRIQEGFCFAHSTAGIINMLLEVEMKADEFGIGSDNFSGIHPCVLQYVLFPPHLINVRESGSDEDGTDDVEPPEGEGELQIITECWIEPQHGRVFNSPPERYYMEGLSYDQLADEMCKVDAECISSLLTFEHLAMMSQEGAPTAIPLSTAINKFIHNDSSQSYCASMRMLPEQRINYMPFAFNLMNLLPKCQQAELLFSVFIQDLSWSFPISCDYEGFSYLDSPNKLLLDMVFESLQKSHDSELYLSLEDSQLFVELVQRRDRDQKVYPLPLPLISLTVPETLPMALQLIDLSTVPDAQFCEKLKPKMFKCPKWKCFLKRISITHLILTFVPASFSDLKLLMLNSISMDELQPKAVKFFPNNSTKMEEGKNLFGKECDLVFKKDSSERIEEAAGSVPESHSVPEMTEQTEQRFSLDLAELRPSLPHLSMTSPFRVRANSLDTMPRKPGQLDLRKRTRTCSMDSRHKKKFSLQPLSPPQLNLDSLEPKDCSTPEPQKLQIPINHNPKYGAITFPIYVYDCPLSALMDVIVYKEYEKRPRDIYEDSSYSRCTEDGGDRLNDGDEPRTGTDPSNTYTSPEPKSEESEASFEKLWLKQHCKMLKISYNKSFVLSLFKSLQLSHYIYSDDVETAVIECEQTMIEIDITKFIQAVCGHLKDFWLRKNLEVLRGVKNADESMEKFPLSFLKQPEQCHKLEYLHLLIKEKFSHILSEFFRVVPNNREFFYCAPNWERERQIEPSHVELERQVETEEADASFEIEYRADGSKVQATPLGSQSWEQGSAVTLDTRTSDSVSDLPDEETSHELSPLFLHLVCSVQWKDHLVRQPVSMLPTCLGELEHSLEDCAHDLDVPALKVYLDVQCLTLPPSDVPSKVADKLQATPLPAVPTNLQTSVSSSDSSAEKELKTEDVIAKLCHLPDHQLKAMTNTINEVQWLLQDEMAAFLLDVFPLSESTLQMVALHIERSTGRPSCLVEKVPLYFVYGPEHSLDKFLQMFSNMTLDGYYLRQEGKYFYLVEDKNKVSHKKRSSIAMPHGAKSLATPSSLAEDSSELWNLCFPLDPSKPLSGLYSDSELQALYLGLDSTPTDEMHMRPMTDSKLHSPLVEIKLEEDTAGRRERKISIELGSRPQVLEGTWGESCSSSVPTPSMEHADIPVATTEEVLGQELIGELWEVKSRLPRQPKGRESPPVVFSRQQNLRARHNSGAASTPGPNSEVSSLVESGQGTEDGYEGDSSDENSAEELTGEWVLEHDGKRTSLPNFWLIMEVTKDCVITHFHCRLTGQGAQEVSLHKETRFGIVRSILNICKLVNQMALLQNLHDKRTCDELLEPESQHDPWKSLDTKAKTNGALESENSKLDTASNAPGSFACNVVWETQFILHPRLKTGPAKRGIQALKSVLTRFSVNNRKNMFVYQDNSGNVFYLRLQESTPALIGTKLTPPSMQGRSTDGEATPPGACVSRSPSISSLMARKTPVEENTLFKMELRPRVRSFGERDATIENMSSPQPSRAEDSVVLKVHGISDAGPEIKEELVQVLHNRLADAVLELLCIMLSRNPMCKLTPDDVHFIQKPHQGADTFLEYSVQQYALTNLEAMVYYLRQNLLQFLHTPKYTDNKAENHFQDYSKPNNSKERVPEEDIFLYNQSATFGSRGMACIAVAVVDDKGLIIKHEHYPKPNSQVDLEMFYEIDFGALTATKLCSVEENLPAARVEFRIWKQGRVNLDLLGKKLQSAMQHAAWDLLMEFRLLTAPLAQPTLTVKKSKSKDEAASVNDRISTPTTPPAGIKREIAALYPPDWVDKYESGESGQLHKIFHQVMSNWLRFAIDIGVPAVKRHSVVFKARQSLAVSLKELQRLVSANASDTALAVFKAISVEQQDVFVPFQSAPSFSGETRWDDANASTTCLLIGRNLQQWKACVSDEEAFDPDVLYPKAQKVFQKFPPLVISNADKCSPTAGKPTLFLQFVPRQRLLLATLSDTEIVILTYNWSKDRSENLNRQVTSLGHWLVARSSLITSIVSQKMGLFNNQAYNRQIIDMKKGSIEQSRLSVKEVEQLVKSPATAQKEFAVPGRRASALPNAYVQDVFRDNKPSKQSQRSTALTDPVWYNGQQLLELCSTDKKESQKKLYQLWQTRVASPNIPVADDVMQLLKQHSRVTHFCLTPLLFLPSWRIQAAATRDHTLAPTSCPQKQEHQDTKSLVTMHSRHESGNSMKSVEGSRSTKSGTSPQTSPKTRKSLEDKWHHKLCINFIQEYKQYLQTMGFIPIQIEVTSPKKGLNKAPASTSGASSVKEERQRKLSGPSSLATPSPQARRHKEDNSYFLQKSLLGGILVFEIMLNEPFFQAKLHALECSRLQTKTSSGLISQFTFGFIDESDKVKILMHLHSFTYDYHLRSIHQYVSSQQTTLKNNFHLRNFLDDFIKYYSKGPNFARNIVHSDTVSISETTTPALQLYNFLWIHEDLYQMEVFCMSPETEISLDNEYVLVQLKDVHHITYKDSHDVKQTDEFDVTLLVAHDPLDEEASSHTLHLKLYIILTSRRELFPKHIVERKLGKFCTVPLATPQLYPPVPPLPTVSECESETELPTAEGEETPSEEASSLQPPPDIHLVTPHVEIRQEAVNYMGYYSSHEQLMQQLIMQHADEVKVQVKTMVQEGMVHCRTHILWETLLSCTAADDKYKRKELSYEEFCELLKLASVESLSLLDHRLGPLLCQSLSWYQSLEKVMATKYGTEVVRRFTSPDSSVQYTVVLAPHYLEAFMMLSIDAHTSRGELSIVCKKPPQNKESDSAVVQNFKNYSPTLQTLIEGFVNACCYHLWAGLV